MPRALTPPRITPPRIPRVPLAGLGITLIAGLAAILLAIGVAQSNRWVAHAIHSQVAIVQVGERMAAFESANRGYFVLGTAEMLPEIARTRQSLTDDLVALRRDTIDNPVQRANLADLRRLLERRVAVLDNAARARPDAAAWARMIAPGAAPAQPLRQALQAQLARMFAEEQRLLTLRQRNSQALIVGLAAGLAITVLLVVVIAYQLIGDAQRRYAALEAAHEQTRAETAAREEAEAQVAQMQKIETLGQLTGGIAHDFNNMLAVVVGSLDLAERHADSAPQRTAGYIAAARDGADRAAALVVRLLAFARRQPLSPAPVDINALVTGMSELLKRTLGEQVVVETHLVGGTPCGFADRVQVENAILNLAVNGRDAMEGRAGTITIVTDTVHFGTEQGEIAAGRYVMIAVADTGAGMSWETQKRAIEPFFTTKPIGRGTGLGLSQVFGFAKQSGGHVAIESLLGEGTIVRLYLPRHDGAVEAPAPPLAIDPQRGRGEHVLLVEDEPLVRTFSEDALRDLGYAVTVATDGADALRIVRDDPAIDLLFTDIIMPGMSGEDVVAAARAIRPKLKMLYTSGYRGGVAPGAPSGDGVALLPKPFTLPQLAAHVRQAIDG